MIVTQVQDVEQNNTLMLILDREDIMTLVHGQEMESMELKVQIPLNGNLTILMGTTPDPHFVQSEVERGVDAISAARESHRRLIEQFLSARMESDPSKMN
jgi:hypothetical protein